MDVGAANFRFTLDDPETKAITMRHPKTAELHLDSLDRYHDPDIGALFLTSSGAPQNVSKLVGPIYGNPANDNAVNNCQIQTKRNLMYGYMTRVALTQFNLSYKVPTIVTGYNDMVSVFTNGAAPFETFRATIPQGYYNVDSLGAALETALRTVPGLASLTVTLPTTQAASPILVNGSIVLGYHIQTNDPAAAFAFTVLEPNDGQFNTERIGRTFRLLGANKPSFGYASETVLPTFPPVPTIGVVPPVLSVDFFMGIPNFRPTDYVDIVSKSLTNYKDTKDGNTSEQAPQPMGRIWLTEYPLASQTIQFGSPQDGMWGMAPMTFTKTWVSPNWSQWSPNQSIYNVDITLLDMWGNPLFWNSTYSTEWSATLTVTE